MICKNNASIFAVLLLTLSTLSSAQYCGFASFNVLARKNRRGRCVLSVSLRVSLGARFTDPLGAAQAGGYYLDTRTGAYGALTTPGNNPRTSTSPKTYRDVWRKTLGTTGYGDIDIEFPYIRASSTRSRGQFCHGALRKDSIQVDENCTRVSKKMRTNLRLKRGDDVAFVIDNTGSMADDIESVQLLATNIVSTISASPSWRIAFVYYNDPAAGVLLDFTDDLTQIYATIAALSASGGGDTPEHVYSGLKAALDMAWRPDASRTIITMGDAPPKDPEPGTGLTEEDIVALANTVNVIADVTPSVRSLAPRNASAGVRQVVDDSVTIAVPVPGASPLMMISVDNSASTTTAFESLSNGTDGKTFPVTDASEVVDAIIEAVKEVIPPPPLCEAVESDATVSVVCREDKRLMCVQNDNTCSLQFRYTDNYEGDNGTGVAVPGETCVPLTEQSSTVWFDFEWYSPADGGKWIFDSFTTGTCV